MNGPRRRPSALHILSGVLLGFVGGADLARADTCAAREDPYGIDPFEPAFPDAVAAVPVDAHPWIVLGCGEPPADCSLISADHTVAVDVHATDTCAEPYAVALMLVEFAPHEPLEPDRQYDLSCIAGPSVTTRATTTPGKPPGAVKLDDVWLERGDDGGGCCRVGDQLVLRLDELDAPYLREGGRIEVEYPDGDIFPVWPDFLAAGGRLPATSGPITLTPIAADGERGTAVQIDSIEFREAAYIPCSVSSRLPPHALWLAVPLMWITFAGRRARGRGAWTR